MKSASKVELTGW